MCAFCPPRSLFRSARGFTLPEIMVVVVLVGVLAALAIPLHQRITRRARETLFMNELRVATQSLERYAMEKGDWPPDGEGTWPAEMREYLPPPDRWTLPTPVGGTWSWTRGTDGLHAALHVTGYEGGASRALTLDQLLDDGDLDAGSLRSTGVQLTYVLEE